MDIGSVWLIFGSHSSRISRLLWPDITEVSEDTLFNCSMSTIQYMTVPSIHFHLELHWTPKFCLTHAWLYAISHPTLPSRWSKMHLVLFHCFKCYQNVTIVVFLLDYVSRSWPVRVMPGKLSKCLKTEL